MMSQGFNRSIMQMTNSPTYLLLYLILDIPIATRSTNSYKQTVFQARLYNIFKEIKPNLRRKKLHRRNESSNFLAASFSKKDNVIDLIQLIIQFFIRNWSIYFHRNSNKAIWPGNLTSWHVPALKWTNNAVHSVSPIQVQNQIQLLPLIRHLITFTVDSSTNSIDSNTADSIIWKVINA